MREEIRAYREQNARTYVKSRRHTIQIHYSAYMAELAQMIDCNPPIFKIIFQVRTQVPTDGYEVESLHRIPSSPTSSFLTHCAPTSFACTVRIRGVVHVTPSMVGANVAVCC